jgi:hypothetical protein
LGWSGHSSGGTASKWLTRPTSLPEQNWQFIIATLNQWLGCFWVEPRAEIWHQAQNWQFHHCYFEPMVGMLSGRTKGWDLALPINRFDFHGPRVERIGSKINKKTSLPPHFAVSRTSLSLRRDPPTAKTFTTSLNTSVASRRTALRHHR